MKIEFKENHEEQEENRGNFLKISLYSEYIKHIFRSGWATTFEKKKLEIGATYPTHPKKKQLKELSRPIKIQVH